ncbi:MAG: DUF4270 domain-containing protein [Bacteroides sp.]
MKLNYIGVVLIALAFFGCDDNTGSLGLGMFPDSDQNIKGHLATFEVTTQSELAEKVFAKTSIGYVGKFTDPYFGYYEAGFLSQLHCIENLTFPTVYSKENPTGTMVKDEVYATELVLNYSNYFGDSLSACRMSIYELNKELDKDKAHYTDINPKEYYNASTGLIGRKAYSAVDMSLSDSIRNLKGFYPFVRIALPNSIGTRIYKACKEGGKAGLTNEQFQKLFKGIYVKSDYGDGTILYVDQIELNVAFEYYIKDSLNNVIKKKYEKDEHGVLKDSTDFTKRSFVATKEIIQANKFKSNEQLIKQRKEETQWTYLKTPAGIYTQATLPLKEIEQKLSKDTINAVKLTFTNYNQTTDYNKYLFSMNAPNYVLLVREQDKAKFFEDNMITNNTTSYLSQHNAAATNQYVFNNLTRLIAHCLAEKEAAKKTAGASWSEEKWLKENPLWNKVALIPVLVKYDTSSQSNPNLISVQNDLKPGYVKLKGGADGLKQGNTENKLKLDVIYTSFGEKK